MAKTAQKIKATTQRFTEISDISENIVILTNGNACMLIEVTATNFALQSIEEQQVKILAYASLLNSLSFPIQVFITNKQLDVSTYLKRLDEQIKGARSQMFAQQISLYKDFVAELVKINTVLDKKFYIVIPYSPLEKGVTGAKAGALGASADPNLINQAKVALKSKAESLLSEIGRINLKARILEKEELVRVIYEIFNGPISQEANLIEEYKPPIVQGQNGGKI